GDERGLGVRELETRGHHADDRVRLLVEPDRPAHDRRVRAELALPQPLAQNDDAARPRLVFFRREGAPARGRDAEQREEARRDALRLDAHGLALPSEVQAQALEGGDPGERAVLLFVVEVFGWRDVEERPAEPRQAL